MSCSIRCSRCLSFEQDIGEEEEMDVLKLAAFAVSGVLLALMLKSVRPEYSTLVSLAVGVCLCLCLMTKLERAFGYLKQLQEMAHLDGTYVGILVKMLGITYISQFASDLCKDAGYQGISGQIELFAKVSILCLSLPVLLTLARTIGEVL